MEQSVNMWNDLLKFIGCKLKWTRYVFYIIDWEFGTEKTPLTTHQSQQIKYYDALRITITLQQLKSHESMTYLALISQINVSLQTQTSHLIKIAHSFSQILVSNHIQQYYAHTFQKWCINPKLTYPLAASSITNQQLYSIQKNLSKVLSSMRYNHNWPKELRYGRHHHQCIVLLDLKVKQRICKIQILHKLLSHP